MAIQSKQSSLLPVYLIAGEDELKRETVMKRLFARLSKMGDMSFNSETFSGLTCTGEEVITAANTLPFASEVRLVLVNDVDKLKKADSAFGSKAIIDCAPFARKDLGNAVRSIAVGHGITLTQGAAATLIDLVGTNTVALDAELKKLSLSHRGTDPVNENEVLSLVSRTAEIKPWEFVDAFACRNGKRCIYLMNRMDVSPFALLAMCTTRIRELITVKALSERGQKALCSKVLKMPDWRLKNHYSCARGFTMDELICALSSARDVEQEMKSGSDQMQSFISWFLGVCKKGSL